MSVPGDRFDPAVGTRHLDQRKLTGLVQAMRKQVSARLAAGESRSVLAREIGVDVGRYLTSLNIEPKATTIREVVNAVLAQNDRTAPPVPQTTVEPEPEPAAPPKRHLVAVDRERVILAADKLQGAVMERLDVDRAASLPRDELERQLSPIIADLATERAMHLNALELRQVVTAIADDMLGLGPIEPLLDDDTVTDIMVNGPSSVFVERRGKLEKTEVRFRDDAHVLNIATRIVTRIGRRVDESTPLCDARLLDGSRVNVIIPPLAIDGPTISIRKFAKKKITLETMVAQHNISPEMAKFFAIVARCRLNILISGGTGSGKTTLLNAVSRNIDHSERVVTIEDAAELQLQQPHVVRLETRPPNVEGGGEIVQRDLVKNALRMRPDRIILGEVRGPEALDMLQAMNTGHDGSLCTVHANRPREALVRLENMVGMAGINLPTRAIRQQISSAINVVMQISRMRDGIRRVVSVMELVGMEGDVITAQDLFTYEYQGEDEEGRLIGEFKPTGLRPTFLPRVAFYGLDRELMEIMS